MLDFLTAPFMGPFLAPALFWPVATFALLVLTYTAIVDARTGLVPVLPIVAAFAAVLANLLWSEPKAVPGLLIAASHFYAVIWSLNMIWRLLYKKDALGMGDASWSFLATFTYDWISVVIAWGAGSILALLYMGMRRLAGRRDRHVHLVPFLLLGLLAALYAADKL